MSLPLNIAGAQTVYSYFLDGNVETVKLVQNGQVVSQTGYTYDGEGRLQTVSADGQTFTYHYQPGTGELASISSSAGVTTGFDYDADTGNLGSIAVANAGGQNLYSAGYAYYDDNQLSDQSVHATQAGGSSSQTSTAYTYNPQQELTQAATTGGVTSTQSYSYDGAGNRTNLGSINSLNQYSNFSYDANGNLLNDGTFSYAYNALGQLIQAQSDTLNANATRVTMGYDADGLRIWKKSFAYDPSSGGWNLTASLKFSYDGTNLIAEFDAFGGADKLLRSYTWGPSGLLSVSVHDPDGSVASTYLTILDANGNVTALVDASTGQVAATYSYDPFGNLVSTTGSAAAVAACPIRFGGGYTDSETGLIYLQNRYYSPSQGRFITRDPSGQSGGYNLYAYADNDPINESDPTGLSAQGQFSLSDLVLNDDIGPLTLRQPSSPNSMITISSGPSPLIGDLFGATLSLTGPALSAGSISIQPLTSPLNLSNLLIAPQDLPTFQAEVPAGWVDLQNAVLAKRLEYLATLSGTARGPMVGGILDAQFGAIFTGYNKEPIGAIHPALEDALIGVEKPHGELVALNKALWARGADATIDDSFVNFNARFSMNQNPLNSGGLEWPSMVRCPVCKVVSNGVTAISDDISAATRFTIQDGLDASLSLNTSTDAAYAAAETTSFVTNAAVNTEVAGGLLSASSLSYFNWGMLALTGVERYTLGAAADAHQQHIPYTQAAGHKISRDAHGIWNIIRQIPHAIHELPDALDSLYFTHKLYGSNGGA